MSFSSFRQYRPRRASRRVDDGRSALRHEGKSQDFLRRHAQDCSRYDRSSLTERYRFARDFVERVADTNNLWCAAIHLAENGDKAPGPNGQRLYRLMREDPKHVRQVLRAISVALKDGTYQPGPSRRVDVPKSNGRGTRPVDIANWQDQVVQRAIVQILDPFLDHQFDELSLGYRSGHDRFEAIARAGALVELDGRRTLLCTDLTNAFTRIPHTPLLHEIENRTGNISLVRLIRRIIEAGGRRRGVAQGGSLSALMLNLYLDRFLDQRWRQIHPDVALIRVADDLLLLCGSAREADDCLCNLGSLLRPTGMELNLNPGKTQIRDLSQGETATWLGFSLNWDGNQLCASLHDTFFEKVRDTLAESLAKADGVLHASEALRGIVDQLGPCFTTEDHADHVLCHLTTVAAELGFREFPHRDNLLGTWTKSATRYRTHCSLWRLAQQGLSSTVADTGSGSASSQSPPAQGPAHLDGPSEPTVSIRPSQVPSATVTVVSVPPAHGAAGWAFHVRFSDQQRVITKCRTQTGETPIRFLLQAALAAIRCVPPEYALRIFTDSRFLAYEWRSVVSNFGRVGWSTVRRGPPPNWDLLVALQGELAGRTARFELIPNGSRDSTPEVRLAGAARV